MAITLNDAQHVAKLARLNLQAAELELYTKQLNDILNYAQQLQSLNTEQVPPTFNPYHSGTIMREDQVVEFKNKEKIINNGPDTAGTSFVVPKIL